jgi:hypothetical protein
MVVVGLIDCISMSTKRSKNINDADQRYVVVALAYARPSSTRPSSSIIQETKIHIFFVHNNPLQVKCDIFLGWLVCCGAGFCPEGV